MCGRYSLTQGVEVLQLRFAFMEEDFDLKPRYNIAPSQNAPVVMVEDEGRRLRMMRWGLVPSWAKEASIGNKMINARSETLAEKPSFKKSLKQRRCLVLADGFYEWQAPKEGKGRKTPMRILLKSREPFAFAGLWDLWKDPDGDELLSFTIITTQANDLIKGIHERMPVILAPEEEEIWLNAGSDQTDRLLSLLDPYPAKAMDVYEVSTAVNSPSNDRPECIEAVA